MLIPRGSIIAIELSPDEPIPGAIAEEVNIVLKSQFQQIEVPSNGLTEGIDIAGGAVRSIFGNSWGFSSQFKQMTMQLWNKTDPARFNLTVDFHREPLSKSHGKQNVSGENVMAIIKRFCSIPLPGEAELGRLIPPGPSIIEGIGLDVLAEYITKKELNRAVDEKGFVDLTIGSMKFKRILMESAEPTFSKYSDDSEYPISCRVAFNFVGIWAATKQMVEAW
jgi:hypothetical protein